MNRRWRLAPGGHRSLGCPGFSQERYGFAFRLRLAVKPQRVAERRAVHDFARLLIVSGDVDAHAEISPTPYSNRAIGRACSEQRVDARAQAFW